MWIRLCRRGCSDRAVGGWREVVVLAEGKIADARVVGLVWFVMWLLAGAQRVAGVGVGRAEWEFGWALGLIAGRAEAKFAGLVEKWAGRVVIVVEQIRRGLR